MGKGFVHHGPPATSHRDRFLLTANLPLRGIAAERREMLLGSQCAQLIHYQKHIVAVHGRTQISPKASSKMQMGQSPTGSW